MLEDTRRSDAHGERERIRRALLARRPALAARLVEGPSGALTVPVGQGRAIEVGRMRRLGRPRWVVVEPMEEGAKVHEPAGIGDCARIVLAALARRRMPRASAA
ncbi:hypothetical protein [Brachybacterium nesterenkovii]|uniref:hypothetical protein n=1 Tax=Brachybacterium nesterenkovii TaxID=47847 RepID=UPI0032195C0E